MSAARGSVLRERKRRTAWRVWAERDRRIRTLQRSGNRANYMLPNLSSGDLRPFALDLRQKCANTALAAQRSAVITPHDEGRAVIGSATIGRLVHMTMDVPVRLRMRVARSMLVAMGDGQAVVVTILRGQPVQPLPQQAHGAISRQQAASQDFSKRGTHGVKGRKCKPRK